MEVVACRTCKVNIVFTTAVAVFFFPNTFMASISLNKQMQAQQCGSCGVQDLKNKYSTYSCCASLFSPKSISNGFLFFVR